MRPARLIPADRLAVVLVAHGSRDPRAAAATEALARAVLRRHPQWDVSAAYLDHAGPRPMDVLASLPAGSRAVLVPLLLTEAYHGRVDVPAVVTAAAGLPIDLTLADVLGPARPRLPLPSPTAACATGPARLRRPLPSPTAGSATDPARPRRPLPSPDAAAAAGPVSSLLLDGLIRRLPSAGLDAVVLAAAGTRDAVARTTVQCAAEALGERLGLPTAVAYASAAPPTAGEAVRHLRAAGAHRVGMAAYFLAPGRLYDVAVRSARDADAVSIADPLGDAPDLVALVGARVEAAASRALTAAA
jgi:sirohydrochlorin ferrochelatase